MATLWEAAAASACASAKKAGAMRPRSWGRGGEALRTRAEACKRAGRRHDGGVAGPRPVWTVRCLREGQEPGLESIHSVRSQSRRAPPCVVGAGDRTGYTQAGDVSR